MFCGGSWIASCVPPFLIGCRVLSPDAGWSRRNGIPYMSKGRSGGSRRGVTRWTGCRPAPENIPARPGRSCDPAHGISCPAASVARQRTLLPRRGDGGDRRRGRLLRVAGRVPVQLPPQLRRLRFLDQRGTPGGAQAGRLCRAGMGTCPASGRSPVDRGRRGALPIFRHEAAAGGEPRERPRLGAGLQPRGDVLYGDALVRPGRGQPHPSGERHQFEHLPGRSRIPPVGKGSIPHPVPGRGIVRRRRPATR